MDTVIGTYTPPGPVTWPKPVYGFQGGPRPDLVQVLVDGIVGRVWINVYPCEIGNIGFPAVITRLQVAEATVRRNQTRKDTPKCPW
jgi:hypothetical protein